MEDWVRFGIVPAVPSSIAGVTGPETETETDSHT